MKTVAISILGTTLDRRGKGDRRWDKWRPNIALCHQDDMIVDRLELVLDRRSSTLGEQVKADIAHISPETQVCFHYVDFANPWDFESVYAQLLDFTQSYHFDSDNENYLIHITTGTHVAQICLYLLTEARYLPGKLIQTSPAQGADPSLGNYQVIDLDLSKYDQIASRFTKAHLEGTTYLKGGISTKNKSFNRMIEQLEQVSIRSSEPILLTGPTGAGKSQLAKRVFELKKRRQQIAGELVSVNCATLRGENAMSTLFGHKKGAFTGATHDRTGLLLQADHGLLFLDEIGELGLDEQAMLLRAIEDKSFMPFGADKEVQSNFQLIAGTNRDLIEEAHAGRFREDLLARIDLWTYRLPSLKERLEDLEANIDFELEAFSQKSGNLVSMNKDARLSYLKFGTSPKGLWSGNFRDLNASITRMATLADGGRINSQNVDEEIERLNLRWRGGQQKREDITLQNHFTQAQLANIDYHDQLLLQGVISVCQQSTSMAEAGRRLFNVSRTQKSSINDSHRVKQILEKFGLSFKTIQQQS